LPGALEVAPPCKDSPLLADDDNMFRFDYKAPFLLWALTPPGYFKGA
jgi:hypothetical protein